jgi:branched-subunit amino acid aminotransferase/4-amino-4-deoxychorismate lyase
MTEAERDDQITAQMDNLARECAEQSKPFVDGLMKVLAGTITEVAVLIEGCDGNDSLEQTRGKLIQQMTSSLLEGITMTLLIELCPNIVEEASRMAMADKLSEMMGNSAPSHVLH